MEDHGFHSDFSVKRKPLSRDSRQNRTMSGSSVDGDAFPLVPVDNSSSWPPPLDYQNTDTSYEAAKHIDPPETAQLQDDGGRHFFNNSSRYSKLPPNDAQQDDSVPVQKTALAYQNAIPEEQDHSVRPRMWNPVWLHSVVLSGFILLFLALLAGLIILWHFGELENGITTDITDNHYAWTYGPTALLVVIGVAWRQVDFYCRTLAPWSHLRHGPASAQITLLLDYVSPIFPKALGTAAANHEWTVLASGLGILLLRIVIVFSTGLLVLTPTPVSKSIDNAIVNSKFVGTDYTTEPNAMDTNLMRYYGIQEQGMEYEYGTTANVAYETLDTRTVLPNATVRTTVNGMFPFFDCEIVEPKLEAFSWGNDGEFPYADTLDLNFTLTRSNCPPQIFFPDICQPTEGSCPTGQHIVSGEGFNWLNTVNDPLSELDPCANLYSLGIVELYFERIDGHPVNTSAAWNVTMPTVVGIVCSIGYTIDSVNVTLNTAKHTAASSVNTTGPLHHVANILPGYSYYNLSADVQNEVNSNDLPIQTEAPYIYDFAKLLAIMNGGSAVALLDSGVLKGTAEKAFKGVAVQIANNYLRTSDSRKVAAEMSYLDQKLQIRIVSVWAMGIGFVLLALMTLTILVWRPRDVVSRSTNSIAAKAAILAASPELQGLLQGAGNLSGPQLNARLSETAARSRVANEQGYQTLSVESASSQVAYGQLPPASSGKDAWWRPMSTSFWFMALASTLPVGVIIALEVLQHESDKHNGLVNISATSIVDHSLPSILASITMTSIAMMYDAVNFAAATLAPYQTLARGSVAAKKTLLGASLGDLPVWSTLEAIRHRHGSATVASSAAIIGSLLTIIASGLFTIENVPFALDVSITTSGKFVPSFSILSDGGAGAIFALIEHNNASYPALTYDELVFPRIAVSSLGEDAMKQLADSEEVTLEVSIPAMRASLNCTLVPRDSMVKSRVVPPSAQILPGTYDIQVEFNTSLPESCPHFLDVNDDTATEIQFEYLVQYDGIYQGAQLSSLNGATAGNEGTTLGAASNPPGCPSLAFIYGYWKVNSTSTENITAMTCIQGFEQVNTNTTFSVSNASFQVASPPVVDEASALWLSSFNSTKWITKYGEFDWFNQNTTDEDDFYQQVNYGPGGIPPEELAGPANTDRFINATQHVYRRFMAQLINSNMRQALNSTEAAAAPRYPATVSSINVLRLKQNATSKLILQIFLGVMLACGVFVYSWRDMRHVLPHSPWSIAGTMSLFAGSEMIERKIIPTGAEFMSDKELAKVFEGYMFSLGWWDNCVKTSDLREQRRFGIDIGKADSSAGKAGVVRWHL